jgi:hypothetical protein
MVSPTTQFLKLFGRPNRKCRKGGLENRGVLMNSPLLGWQGKVIFWGGVPLSDR